MTTDELLAQVCSVHNIMGRWYAYANWRTEPTYRLTGKAVAQGDTPREAMERVLEAACVPYSPTDRIAKDATLKEVVGKVVKQMSPLPADLNADLFG